MDLFDHFAVRLCYIISVLFTFVEICFIVSIRFILIVLWVPEKSMFWL